MIMGGLAPLGQPRINEKGNDTIITVRPERINDGGLDYT